MDPRAVQLNERVVPFIGEVFKGHYTSENYL